MLSFRLSLLLLFCLRPSLGWRSFNMDFTGYDCEIVDPTVVKKADLRLVTVNKHHAINGSFAFRKNVNEFEIDAKLTFLRPRQEPVDIVNTVLDGCETLESHFRPKTHVVVKWAMREFRTMNGTFPERCPILKDQDIVFNNFYVDPERLPPYLPDLSYRIQIHLRMGGRYVYKSFINASIFTVRSGDRPKKGTKRWSATY